MAASKITNELLDALLSADTQRRREAETYFQGLHVQERVVGLVPFVQQQNHLAAVLLRRDMLKLTDVQAVESLISPLLESFLAGNSVHSRVAIGHCLAEICGTVALLSPSPKDKEQVMARILNAISSAVAQGDIPSLRLLAAMAERSPAVFARTAASSLESLTHQIATTCLINGNRNDSLLEALMHVLVQAAISTEQSQDTPILPFSNQSVDTVDPSSPAASLGRACMPLLMKHLSVTLSTTGSSTLAILQEWTQAASQCPSFLAGDKPVLEAVIHTSLSLAYTHHQSDSVVALAALEVISALCAVGDVKHKILSQDPALCTRILQGDGQQQGVIALTAHFMSAGMDDDVEGWASEPASLLEEDPWDGDDTAHHAESLLQSFLHSFGAPSLAVALPLVESLLQPNPDWRRLCAGLGAMEACLAFAPVSFAPHIPIATEAALNLANQSQPIRVQWQALRLLGVLCETDTKMDDTFSVRILQTLAQSVRSPCTKVSALACLAVVSYCRGGATKSEDGPHPVVAYLADLMQALTTGPLSLQAVPGQHVDRGAAVVMNRAIGAVACLAQTSEEAFAPFYGTVMPGLLACSQLQHRGSHEITQLIGASIESATIVGQAIESDEATRSHYAADAEKIMQFIVPILQQQAEGAKSEMPLDPLLSACARIAAVMKSEYIPFVNMVLPHLLQRATAPPDVSVTDGDEAGLEATKRNELDIDEDLGTESLTIATPGKGIQKLTVNTSQIQEKAQAARAVYEHASALGADFGPYVESCMVAFLPLISFEYSPDVRSTSAQAVASIFEAACQAADESGGEVSKLQQYFPILVKTLTKQIHGEGTADMDALYALADALSEINYACYLRKDTYGRLVASSLSLADAKGTVRMTMESITACLKRRADIYRVLSGQEGALTGEDEREECHGRLKEEEQLLTPLVDSIGYTIKFFKETFVNIFDKFVAPALGPSLTNGDIRARLCAVCLYDDLVEHCCGSEAATRHAEKLIYGILLGVDPQSNGNDLELQSASIYGVSQICRYAPSTILAPHLETIVHHLMLVVKSSSKDESQSPMMYENAVSALASLFLIGNAPFAGSSPFPSGDLLNIFLDNLPFREDPDEAKICHAGFCDLVEKGSINMSTSAVKVLQVVGEIFALASEGEDVANQETCSRLAEILAGMQQQLPADKMNEAFASISEEARNGINLAMQ